MPDEKTEFAELFFADSTGIKADAEGLIWKPMLPVGIWKVGPNGRALKVIAGNSSDPRRAIGLKDIESSFNDGAIAHVTIPLSHDDRVDENTGYVKKVKIQNHNGVPTLFGGHQFTDENVQKKVTEGSIANTSVGLEYDYVRKDDGKKFPIVLRHNALTNRPWLGSKLAPFGVNAADADVDYEVESFQFAEPLDDWKEDFSFSEIREKIQAKLSDEEIVDLSQSRVLVKKGEKYFVVNFSTDNNEVTIDEPGQWVERALLDTTGLDGNISHTGNTTKETATMSDVPKVPEGTPTPSPAGGDSTKDTPDISQNPYVRQLAETAEQTKSENASLKARLDQLTAKDRVREAADFVKDLKELGFSEEKGHTAFLKKCYAIALSDHGDTQILLTEDGNTPRPVGALDLVKELLFSLKGEDGKLAVQFSEQQTDPLKQSKANKPPIEVEGEEASLADRIAAAEAFFEEHKGEIVGPMVNSTSTKEN